MNFKWFKMDKKRYKISDLSVIHQELLIIVEDQQVLPCAR